MNPGIHPEYPVAKISCACGAAFDMFSTKGSFSVEVCANCHPFYTGKQKMLDTKGRVDRFRKKYAAKEETAKLSPTAGRGAGRRSSDRAAAHHVLSADA